MNDALREVAADAIADEWDGAAGTLEIRTGAAPGATNSATGTVLATVTLPAPAFGAASAGVVAKTGTWEDTSADATGTAAHFRITSNGGGDIMEGTVTATSGGGDMEVDNVSFASGQAFTVTAFGFTVGA